MGRAAILGYTGHHRTLDTRGRGGDDYTAVNTYLEKEKNSVLLCSVLHSVDSELRKR